MSYLLLDNGTSKVFIEYTFKFQREIIMTKKNQHVVPHSNGWAVKGAGNSKATSLHATQTAAIIEAKSIAQNQRSEMFIHGRNGQIRERNTYGVDPFPPKG